MIVCVWSAWREEPVGASGAGVWRASGGRLECVWSASGECVWHMPAIANTKRETICMFLRIECAICMSDYGSPIAVNN